MLSTLILALTVLTAPVDQDPLAKYKVDLVPIGKMVPNFKVKDDNDKDFDLYKTFKNKNTKATILNFWFAH